MRPRGGKPRQPQRVVERVERVEIEVDHLQMLTDRAYALFVKDTLEAATKENGNDKVTVIFLHEADRSCCQLEAREGQMAP